MPSGTRAVSSAQVCPPSALKTSSPASTAQHDAPVRHETAVSLAPRPSVAATCQVFSVVTPAADDGIVNSPMAATSDISPTIA